MLAVLWWLVAVGQVSCWTVTGKTRVVSTRQGQLRGLIVAPAYPGGQRSVEIFLGLPYAAAPVGSLRFMPPGSPPPWLGLKFADTMGPACPQVLPEVDENPRKISSGRLAYLKRLLPYLKKQSEDCLYLNIYAPKNDFPLGPSKLPVMVFIHGESFQWNSGNPYDGSILASYSDVIVVTINFRLGILGFLKPGLGAHTLSNFGLLDQIAALQWVRDNIQHFGGNPTSVTLIGHHTGAVAVNYLMLSPVAQVDNGLFHRAILMSGTALADWGSARHPEQSTLQVAEAVNCPTTSSEELLSCLRRKRVSDLLAVPLGPDQLGPTVDGNVVPNTPREIMAQYTDLFSRYDLLCGVTESESYHMLDNVSLLYGMLEGERDKLLKEYFRQKYQIRPEVAQAHATAFYGELERGESVALSMRDATLSLLSDSRVVAPLIQTAVFHSAASAPTEVKTFFYVFGYRSANSDYPTAEKSVQGEDLAYMLGVPLGGSTFHLQANYDTPEKLLSEVVMTLWTNFAKTGNPNRPKKRNFFSQTAREWHQYDMLWPEFDVHQQSFFKIDIPPSTGKKYRGEMVRFWNEFLPKNLNNPMHPGIWTKPYPSPLIPPWYDSSRPDTWSIINRNMHRTTNRPMYGIVNYHAEEKPPSKKTEYPFAVPAKKETYDPHMDSPNPTESNSEEHLATASSFTFSIIIFVGVCFLLVNVASFLYICYQKKKLRSEITSRYRGSNVSIPLEDHYMKKEPDKGEVKSILKSSEGSYEPLKLKNEKPNRWPGMYRQGSSSTMTMDPHTKVTEWIAQEIVHRCSPSFMRKSKTETDRASNATTSKLAKTGSQKRVKKVSVAVDATPSTRSASVLKQIPIELTKSLDEGGRRLGGRLPGRPVLQRSEAVEDGREVNSEPAHVHSYSDPVEMNPVLPSTSGELVVEKVPENSEEPKPQPSIDINVTCRDEAPPSQLTPEEALDNIKRRNFPKVLPDLAEAEVEAERRAMLSKRMSVPQCPQKKVPPPPPPRVSTLGRKPKRVEPKVIIKPGEPGEPGGARPRPDRDVPRVRHPTAQHDEAVLQLPPEQYSPRGEPKRPEPMPTMASLAAQLKVQPVKKTVSTETSTDTPKEANK